MKIKVTSCKNCPFKVLDYDPNVNGYDSLEYCKLQRFLTRNLEKYVNDTIRVFDSFEEDWDEINTPDWCPLNELNIIKEV